ncbi:MAG: hypothetical protein ACPG7W_04275 [Paracoccaceae bacterium]
MPRSLSIALAVCLASTAPALAYDDGSNARPGFVTANALNLRASHPGPKSHGSIWIPLPRCTEIAVHLEKTYDGEPWLLVTYEHLTGWVWGKHIAKSRDTCS